MNNMSLVLIFIIISIIILYLLYLYAYKYEYFLNGDDDYTYINDNILNISEKNKQEITTTTFVNIIDYIKKNNKISKEIISLKTDKFKLLIDPYISKYIFNNGIITRSNDVYKEGIFVCLSHLRIGLEKCIWDFNGKTVAYIYMSDYLFIQAIIKAYRQDITRIRLQKIKLEDLKLVEKQFDYLFTYVVIDSEYMNLLKNSRYYINGLKDFDYYRLKLFYPPIEYNYNTIKYYFNKNDDNTTYNIYLNNDKVLIPIMKYDVINNIQNIDIIENFITRLELPKDYLEYDNNADTINMLNNGVYACYGNNNIKKKFECDSYYTKEGKEKNYYSIWDKKCSSNDECPYYKANTNYNNNRGGCINGYCELPVGVKRIGFTKYSDIEYNQPFCYECTDTTDLNCCANIANVKEFSKEDSYNNDYVFENDTEDRIKNNLNTIITLLDYRNI